MASHKPPAPATLPADAGGARPARATRALAAGSRGPASADQGAQPSGGAGRRGPEDAGGRREPRTGQARGGDVPAPVRLVRPRRAAARPEPAGPRSFGALITPGSGERWRDAARLLLVLGGVGLLLLLANGSAVGQAVATALDWCAYLVPPLCVALGLDLLRRAGGARPLLRFEEINGLLCLFLAGMVAAGSQHHAGPAGNALADELGLYFGAASIPVAGVFLLALGLVLALHLTASQAWLGLRTAVQMTVGTGRLGFRALGAARRAARRAGLGHRRVRRMEDPPPDTAGLIIDAEVISRTTALPVDDDRDAPARAGAGSPQPDEAGRTVPGGAAGRSGPRVARGRPQDGAGPAAGKPGEARQARLDQDEEEAGEDAGAEGDADGRVGAQEEQAPSWPRPPLSILNQAPDRGPDTTPADNAGRMRVIEETLASFNVRARVVGAHSGPTVTQFDVQPERGVRVQRITALQHDLALALAARSIRVQAPVPGRSVIGIEIPNATTSLVTLREVLESETCARMTAPLKIALGKDVSGGPVLADLARMPHLLIAGSTGSGKSVLLNSLISCLLFNNGPDRLRLLMVDPKMVELTVFNGVPHLLADVVTDVTKVTGVLKWALKEMHRRYKLFAEQGARNLARFNELQRDPGTRLPFIVLIIDELADLMMVSPEDVEDGICRLAQLARATGIHLVLATQRPSVDVITGLIKANFPARIAFAVSSQVDSRTILDQAGAEKLLGRGDMLYQPSDEGKPIRAQGAFLSDREIEELVAFWKGNAPGALERIPEADLAAQAKEEEGDADDKLLNEAIRVLREYRRASVSLLQRRLSIGYTRAARLLDALEERGVVGPSEDGRSRVVLDTGADGEVEGDDHPPL